MQYLSKRPFTVKTGGRPPSHCDGVHGWTDKRGRCVFCGESVSNVVAGRDTRSIGELKPGEYQIRVVDDYRVGSPVPELFIGCPNGKGLCCHPIAPGVPNANGSIWQWDGNRELPTLTPSIYCQPEKGGCGFHGFLNAGVLK